MQVLLLKSLMLIDMGSWGVRRTKVLHRSVSEVGRLVPPLPWCSCCSGRITSTQGAGWQMRQPHCWTESRMEWLCFDWNKNGWIPQALLPEFLFIHQLPYMVLWEGVLTQKVTSKKDGIPVRPSFGFHTEQNGREKVCLKEEGPGWGERGELTCQSNCIWLE